MHPIFLQLNLRTGIQALETTELASCAATLPTSRSALSNLETVAWSLIPQICAFSARHLVLGVRSCPPARRGGRMERFTTRDMDGNETWRALATSTLFSSNTRASPVPEVISVGRVILAGLTEELPRLHRAGEMAKLHARHLEFAIDFDAEPIARRDLEWGGPADRWPSGQTAVISRRLRSCRSWG
jgi:hypothetical protein